MAHITDHAPAAGMLSRFWDLLVHVGESSSRAQTVNKISAMSDDQIHALGMTRAELVRRALGDY